MNRKSGRRTISNQHFLKLWIQSVIAKLGFIFNKKNKIERHPKVGTIFSVYVCAERWFSSNQTEFGHRANRAKFSQNNLYWSWRNLEVLWEIESEVDPNEILTNFFQLFHFNMAWMIQETPHRRKGPVILHWVVSLVLEVLVVTTGVPLASR